MKPVSKRRVAWAHAILGVIACGVVPAMSWRFAAFGPAWAMYTTSATFRLDIAVIDSAGRATLFPEERLAPRLTPHAADSLAQPQRWRHAPLFTTAAHLGDLARVVCRETDAASVRVTLTVRRSTRDAANATSEEVRCR